MAGAKQDLRVRLAAFEWLARHVGLHRDVLSCSILAAGFVGDPGYEVRSCVTTLPGLTVKLFDFQT